MIVSRDGSHRLLFIEVPDASPGEPDPPRPRAGRGTARRRARTAAEHGAVEVADLRGQYGPGTGWVVLADPEGNEFCILRNLAEREAAPARRRRRRAPDAVSSGAAARLDSGPSLGGGALPVAAVPPHRHPARPIYPRTDALAATGAAPPGCPATSR